MKLILGSKSQGRREVLTEAGYDFEVITADFDEKSIRDTDPEKLVLKLANAKADAILPKITELFDMKKIIVLSIFSLVFMGFGCTNGSLNTGRQSVVPSPVVATPAVAENKIIDKTPEFSSGRKLSEDTLTLAQADGDSAYNKVESRGGEFISLDHGNNYGVWWQPDGFDPESDVVIVSLGGHGGWATKDFDVWYPEISQRGYGFFTLQWWLGRSLESKGYYEPEEMYAMIAQVLTEKEITPGNVIFQGYSMGSARSYGITALDQSSNKYFGLTISNSGVFESDYPINAKILAGEYGENPYIGTHWILYCAVNDEEHTDWNKCEKMDETQSTVEQLGGSVELYIKDQVGGHGSFMVDSKNVEQALDVADKIVTGQ